MEIGLERVWHRENDCIAIKFKYDVEVFNLLRTLPGGRWSKTHKAWLLNYSETTLSRVCKLLSVKNTVILKDEAKPAIAIKEEGIKLNADAELKITEFENWMRSKRYSESTIGTYTDALKIFLRFYAGKTIGEITNNDVIIFNNEYILKNKLSASYQNQVVNAIKLFFSTVESRAINTNIIHRPKTAKTLPNVLSKEEIKQILSAHGNLKHKAMLSLIYSCGLRCGELLKLKPEHIDSKRGLVIIKQSKGRKDRIVPLSAKILDLLREYYVAYTPKYWLFEGQSIGHMYDERSLQQVLKQSLIKANISKPVSLHWLRHSYATHLLESGTDLRYIQELLGHSRSTTTEIYTHVSNKEIQRIASPFDSL